jgi:hypothetical protein
MPVRSSSSEGWDRVSDFFECSAPEACALSRELVNCGLPVRLRVRGQSMAPLIRDGDVIRVIPVSVDQVAVGDVILFRTGTGLLAHRVIERDQDPTGVRLITRGDGHWFADAPLDNAEPGRPPGRPPAGLDLVAVRPDHRAKDNGSAGLTDWIAAWGPDPPILPIRCD